MQMSKTETLAKFIEACEVHGVHPSIALENEEVKAAVAARDFDRIANALLENF